jgi:hypothetical protein
MHDIALVCWERCGGYFDRFHDDLSGTYMGIIHRRHRPTLEQLLSCRPFGRKERPSVMTKLIKLVIETNLASGMLILLIILSAVS